MRFLGSPRIAKWSPRITIRRPLGNMRIAIMEPWDSNSEAPREP